MRVTGQLLTPVCLSLGPGSPSSLMTFLVLHRWLCGLRGTCVTPLWRRRVAAS